MHNLDRTVYERCYWCFLMLFFQLYEHIVKKKKMVQCNLHEMTKITFFFLKKKVEFKYGILWNETCL